MRQDIQEVFQKAKNRILVKGADVEFLYRLLEYGKSVIEKENLLEDGREILRYARQQA